MELEDAIEEVRYYLSLQDAEAALDLEDAISSVRSMLSPNSCAVTLDLEEAVADVRFQLQADRMSDYQRPAPSSAEERAHVYAGALHTLLTLLRDIGEARDKRSQDSRPVRRLSDVRVNLFDVVADQISRELYPDDSGELDFLDIPNRKLS